MHRESSESQARSDSQLERAIVLELLSNDEQSGRALAELGDALGADATELGAALRALHAAGVLELDEHRVAPTAATRCLDKLELIGI
jgi:hypothetical protein